MPFAAPLVRAPAIAALAIGLLGAARATAAADPAWLALRPGTAARVDIGLWATADEPEAALTASAASLAGDLADASRPGDIVYEPVGVRVRIVRVRAATHVALVRGVDRGFVAYARLERLVPSVPRGTRLVAAGGFAGFADFYEALATPSVRARRLPTGSALVVLETGVAPFDPGSFDLVRLRVRVESGPLRGRLGWVAVAYAGLPAAPRARADVAERACRCRLVQFGAP